MDVRGIAARFLVLFLFSLSLAACWATAPVAPPTAVPTTTLPSRTVTAVLSPTVTPLPIPTLTPTPLPPDVSITSHDIFVYPVPAIYEGDRITIQVMPSVPEPIVPESVSVHVLVGEEEVAVGTLNGRNLAGQAIGLFEWVWESHEAVGSHDVRVILDRDNQLLPQPRQAGYNEATVTITVRPAAQLHQREANATWVQTESNCCVIHVVSGTAAYRDLPQLVPRIETAVQTAADRLVELPLRKINVYLVDRVIGQGGYAGTSMVISYSDRPYHGGQLEQLLIHEATHVIDRQFAPRRIPFLAEGVAVWASGGHYKPEDIEERMAALVALDYYLPLEQVINDFYPVQHEIGYLQAASFVDFLIRQKGWGRFRTFYSNVTAGTLPTPAMAVDFNLQTYYDTTLDALEADWLAHIQSRQPSAESLADLQTSLNYYDTMRYYQIHYDPGAYFLNAWLPYPHEVQQQGNPADLNRRPQNEINIVLEIMFLAADEALQRGDFNRATVLLDSIARVIENGGAFLDPLALNYLEVVRAVNNLGYAPHQVAIEGSRATVTVTPNGQTNLIELNLQLRGRRWLLTS